MLVVSYPHQTQGYSPNNSKSWVSRKSGKDFGVGFEIRKCSETEIVIGQSGRLSLRCTVF
jgi:hypothetical protein